MTMFTVVAAGLQEWTCMHFCEFILPNKLVGISTSDISEVWNSNVVYTSMYLQFDFTEFI